MIGKNVIHKQMCETSSMDWAKELFHEVEDGTVFWADEYKIARGRQGREWKLYPGQLVLTFVLKPTIRSSRVSPEVLRRGMYRGTSQEDFALRYLNMALTIGIADVLSEYGVGVKWPNDFMLNDKKVGGMIIEAVWLGDVIEGVVVGISVNCNNKFNQDDDLYNIATSIKQNIQQDILIDSLQKKLLNSIDKWYNLWKGKDFETIFSAWKNKLICLGKVLSVHCKDGSLVSGYAQDVTTIGDLVLIDSDGNKREIPFCVVDTTSF